MSDQEDKRKSTARELMRAAIAADDISRIACARLSQADVAEVSRLIINRVNASIAVPTKRPGAETMNPRARSHGTQKEIAPHEGVGAIFI
jgi:hypothetical protein